MIIMKSSIQKSDSLKYYELKKDLSKRYVGDRKFYGVGPFEVTSLSQGRIAIGNDYFRYKIDYRRNNIWYEIIDSVYIKKGETFRDTIYY